MAGSKECSKLNCIKLEKVAIPLENKAKKWFEYPFVGC